MAEAVVRSPSRTPFCTVNWTSTCDPLRLKPLMVPTSTPATLTGSPWASPAESAKAAPYPVWSLINGSFEKLIGAERDHDKQRTADDGDDDTVAFAEALHEQFAVCTLWLPTGPDGNVNGRPGWPVRTLRFTVPCTWMVRLQM